MSAFVILNGYPGVGKLTIGRELCQILPNAKLFSNHLLIDAAVALYKRGDPHLLPLRCALRQAIFASLHSSAEESHPRIIIFTEAQSTSGHEPGVMREYLEGSRWMNYKLISFVLTCPEEINQERLISRAAAVERQETTKLVDIDVLQHIRQTRDIFHYGSDAFVELDVDVSQRPAKAIAEELGRAITKALE